MKIIRGQFPKVVPISREPCGRALPAFHCNGFTFLEPPSPKEAIANLELLLKSAQWPPEMEKEGAREMAAVVLAVLKESVK